MELQEHQQNVKLTSAELSQLWAGYMNDSASICQLTYFLEKAEDEKIKEVIDHALKLANAHIEKLTIIFNTQNYPIPHGFKLEEDVDVTAPRLYSDSYVLNFINQLGKIGLTTYAGAVGFSVRKDVYLYFSECLAESDRLVRQSDNLLMEKGLYIRPPYLETPENIDFIREKSFLAGYFREKRPLIATEIANVYANFQRNALGISTLMGFSQVAQSTEVRKFLVRGKEVAKKHCEIFASTLRKDDLPAPMTWDTDVTDSTSYTFSDKLMMFYTTTLIALSVGFYGASMSQSPRRDLGVRYNRLVAEILKFAEDGAQISIQHGWMEEPPRALDRDELAKKK